MEDLPSGGVCEGSDVDGVDQLGATTGGAVVERYFLVKSVGRKVEFAI